MLDHAQSISESYITGSEIRFFVGAVIFVSVINGSLI